MILSHYIGLHSLNQDLLKNIYLRFSTEERLFVLPNVCRAWNLAFRNIGQEDFRNFTKKVIQLIPGARNKKYQDVDLDGMLKISKLFSLISHLKTNPAFMSWGMGNEGFLDMMCRNRDLKKVVRVYQKTEGHLFTPFGLQIKIENSDYVLNYEIRWKDSVYKQDSNMVYQDSKLCVEHDRVVIKKDDKWEEVRGEKLDELHLLVGTAYETELKMRTIYFTFLNLLTIANLNYFELDNPDFGVSFNCTEQGLIIQKNDETQKKYSILKIQKKIIDGAKVLTWETEDKKNYHSDSAKATDVLRWSVYASTLKKLAVMHHYSFYASHQDEKDNTYAAEEIPFGVPFGHVMTFKNPF